MPGIIGSTGWDRSRAWTWDFSSAHSTTACSGGFRYSPTTSQTFPANSGSEDSLKVSDRCGLRWKAFQIRPMVDRDKPERSAMDALDQWVASSGVSSSVSTMTFFYLLVGDRGAHVPDAAHQRARPGACQ